MNILSAASIATRSLQRIPRGRGVLCALLLGWAASSGQAAVIGDYHFAGDFTNSQGDLPSMSMSGDGSSAGFLPGGGWSWGNAASAGLKVETGPLANYSIALSFQFSDVDSYRKLIDFSNLSTDAGFYLYGGLVALYTGSGSFGDPGVVFSPDTRISLVITRSSDGATNIYTEGRSVSLLTITDEHGYFAISDNVYFFLDDRGGSELSPEGNVSLIRFWDTVLTPEQAASAFQPIPEPATTMLLITAGSVILALRSRRLHLRTQNSPSVEDHANEG